MAPLGSVAGRKLAALTTELGGRVGTPGGVPAWVTVRICPPVMVSVPMREPGSGLAATAYCTRSVPPPLVPEVMVIQLTSLLAFQSQRVEISTLPVPPFPGNADAHEFAAFTKLDWTALSCTRLSAFFVVSRRSGLKYIPRRVVAVASRTDRKLKSKIPGKTDHG